MAGGVPQVPDGDAPVVRRVQAEGEGSGGKLAAAAEQAERETLAFRKQLAADRERRLAGGTNRLGVKSGKVKKSKKEKKKGKSKKSKGKSKKSKSPSEDGTRAIPVPAATATATAASRGVRRTTKTSTSTVSRDSSRSRRTSDLATILANLPTRDEYGHQIQHRLVLDADAGVAPHRRFESHRLLADRHLTVAAADSRTTPQFPSVRQTSTRRRR